MQIQINTWQLQTGWFHPYMEDFFEYISLSAIWTADCEWNCMVEEIRAIVSPPIQFSSFCTFFTKYSAKRRNKKDNFLIFFTNQGSLFFFRPGHCHDDVYWRGLCFYLNVDYVKLFHHWCFP